MKFYYFYIIILLVCDVLSFDYRLIGHLRTKKLIFRVKSSNLNMILDDGGVDIDPTNRNDNIGMNGYTY